jgi:hypothetical protein
MGHINWMKKFPFWALFLYLGSISNGWEINWEGIDILRDHVSLDGCELYFLVCNGNITYSRAPIGHIHWVTIFCHCKVRHVEPFTSFKLDLTVGQ